jgi:branched-chain amino acid transport system substrate-binding protein
MKHGLYLAMLAGLLALGACVPKQAQKPGTGMPATSTAPVVAEAQKVTPRGAIPQGTPTVKIALLLPLSGDSAAVGNAMLDAANMALYDSYLSVPSDKIRSQVILIPKDTGSVPADALRAVQQAIDQGATFVIGPLFSQSVTAISPTVREKGITMLTFSNNKAVAGNGVYVFGFLPEQQVERMSDYAFLHGAQRVAVLAPNDSYGEKINETLKTIYGKKGGIVSPTEFYAPSPTNIDAAVARLVETYNNATEERKFQAIFIADGGYQLRNIIQSLKKTDLDLTKIRLLGTGMWDDPEIAKIPEMHGAWFSSSPPDTYKDFERRFMTVYGYKPVRLASLAYDAASLAAVITMPKSDTAINVQDIMDQRGFLSPANGLFRLRDDGTADRKLAIMEVTAEGFKVIDTAPKKFENQ